jgi:hypothetical protein
MLRGRGLAMWGRMGVGWSSLGVPSLRTFFVGWGGGLWVAVGGGLVG